MAPQRSHHRLLTAVLMGLALIFVTNAATPAGTQCPEARVRKSWLSHTPEEKNRYIRAVGRAMALGHHQKFVELHTETRSELEAHGQCMFIYWHRMFLLGYENMLRSLDAEFQCVTIPYWDHLTATAKRAANQCSSLGNCSEILQDFGGTQLGSTTMTLKIYDVTIPASTDTRPRTCVNQSMLTNFCGNNTVCARCVIRGPAHLARYPSEAYYGSVYQQIFSATKWTEFATNVERGVHNTVHSALGGIMAYLQSPIDPIFYSHHSFIDLLQTLYVKCRSGSEAVLSASVKLTTPYWEMCSRRNGGGSFTTTASVTMNTRQFDFKTWVDVRTGAKTTFYPFFKDLPSKFVDYIDARSLGVYSYTYQLSGGLSTMYEFCADSINMEAASTQPLVLLNEERAKDGKSKNKWGLLRAVVRAGNAFDDKTKRWTIALNEAARLTGYTAKAARDQMELILCVHKDECLGGVADYTDVFRKNFHVTGHPRCWTLLEMLKKGDRIIGIPHWRDISAKFLPCPMPKTDTIPKTLEGVAAME